MTEVAFGVSFSLFTWRRVVLCWLRSRRCGGGRVRGLPAGSSEPSGHLGRRGSGESLAAASAASVKPLALRSLGVRGSSHFVEAKMRFAFWASCSSWKAVLESSPEYVMVLAHAVRGPARTERVFVF